jgi:hypothetical protein
MADVLSVHCAYVLFYGIPLYIMNVHFVANIDSSKFNKPVFEGILRT